MSRLVIQTNLNGQHHLWLVSQTGKILDQHHSRHQHHGADRLLLAIDRLIGTRRIDGITVVRGPGPFTAIRAALVVANTLGWLKHIPVAGLVRHKMLTREDLLTFNHNSGHAFTRPVRPWYGRQPNITLTRTTVRRPKLTRQSS